MKKKLSIVLSFLLLTLTAQSAFASDRIESVQVEQLPDGSCFVTVIEDVPQIETQTMAAKTTTKTKSKTVYYKNASGEVMWWVKVTGTFTYGNGTSKCTKAIPSAGSEKNSWKVSGLTGSKMGGTAIAKATGKQYTNGKVTQTITKTAILNCSPTGTFS